MPEIPFTPAQADRLREMCGLTQPWHPPLTASAILVILETWQIIELEARRWSGGPP
jgi:hypothetical protein